MSAPNEALADAQGSIAAQEKFNERVEDAKAANASFAATIQNSIFKNANPSPVLISVLVLLVVIVLWLLHRYFSPSIWGIWYDSSGEKYVIRKNEDAKVHIAGAKKTYIGTLSANVLDLEGGLGLWNGSNRILLPDNTMLTKQVQ